VPFPAVPLVPVAGLALGAGVFAETAPWPQWVAIPANLVGFALLGYVILSGKWVRKEEADAALDAAEKLADERVRGAERVVTEVRERLAAVVVDRDAWRQAHQAEVEALQHAERTSAELMQGNQVTVGLLAALSAALGHGPVVAGGKGGPDGT
jgi:hypothetical protein